MKDPFNKVGIQTKGILSVTPRETNELVAKGVFIIDLRETDFSDYKAFGVDAVINMPMSIFDQGVDGLDKNAHYILADSSGLKSRLHAEKLLNNGFKHVAILSGGFIEWERDGFPVSTDVNERLSGACACQLKPRERK